MTYFDSDFSIGETVFAAGTRIEQMSGACEWCQATGKVQGGGDERLCPDCRGDGTVRLDEWLKVPTVRGPLTIGRIEVKFYGPDDDRNEERYMCEETGIGSGTVWGGTGNGVAVLYRTKRSAEGAAKRMASS